MADQQLILAMQNIGTAMTAINTTMQTLQTSSQKNVMQKPAKYNGRTSADAQRFMATFAAWADGESSLHNVTAGQRVHDESKWICTALSYLEDDAAIWATPSLEALGTGNPPFGGLWNTFKAEFQKSFKTINKVADAKVNLENLFQKSQTVGQYYAKFQTLTSRTGYSAQDLRDRFYKHLADCVKDQLALTNSPKGTLEELVTTATEIDTRIHEREAEKARDSGKHTGSSTIPRFHAHTHPFADQSMAMEIDASQSSPPGCTREDFQKHMAGRCYGCGSKDHQKKDGGHDRSLCDWCGRTGHLSGVCQDWFMGKPKGQAQAQIAASNSSPAQTHPSTPDLSHPASPAPAIDPQITAASADQLAIQIKQLEQQMKALMESF